MSLPEEVKAQMPDGRILIQKLIEQSTPSFYINSAVFSFTKWDIRVELSEMKSITATDEDPQTLVAQVIRKATIMMTPAYAKTFLEALKLHMEKYEGFEKGEVDKEARDSEPSTE